MNIYTNPRLKHVKKIETICRELEMRCSVGGYTSQILDQCNLLLETKKAKKRKKESYCYCQLDNCYHCQCHNTQPDPKEESKCDHNYVYADIPNGEDGNYCTKCKQAEPEYTPTESKECDLKVATRDENNNVVQYCSSVLGHFFDSGVCRRCGMKEPTPTPSRSEVKIEDLLKDLDLYKHNSVLLNETIDKIINYFNQL